MLRRVLRRIEGVNALLCPSKSLQIAVRRLRNIEPAKSSSAAAQRRNCCRSQRRRTLRTRNLNLKPRVVWDWASTGQPASCC